jgi:two-component system nitrate/nitrite response regulator NarL
MARPDAERLRIPSRRGTAGRARKASSALARSKGRTRGQVVPFEPRGLQGRTRVLIVDRRRLLADIIVAVLREDGVETARVAGRDDAEILASVVSLRPDLVLLSLAPGDDMIRLGTRIIRDHPTTRVMAVDREADPRTQRIALEAGFSAYLTTGTPLSQFVGAIGSVLGGDKLASRPAARAGYQEMSGEPDGFLAGHLTPREREVLMLLADGLDTGGIAARLSVTHTTARTHISNILAKLQVHSRLEAVAFAYRHGLVYRRRRRS